MTSSSSPSTAAATSDMASSTTTTMRTEGPASSSYSKTTTYETRSSSSYVADTAASPYRPTIAPRTYVIQRTAIGGLGSAPGGSSMSRSIERSAQFSALQAGAPAGMSRSPTLHFTSLQFNIRLCNRSVLLQKPPRTCYDELYKLC